MSEELADLEAYLKEAESASECVIEEVDVIEPSQANTEIAIHFLIETLRNKEFMSAVAQVKAFRSIWPNDIFGGSDDDPVKTLLHIYFHHQALGQPGSFAVIGTNQDLSKASSNLMEINLELRETIRLVQSYELLARGKSEKNLLSTGF